MKFINIFMDVLKNFSDFKTRTGRSEFWIFVLVNILISIVIGFFRSTALSSLYSLLVLVPGLAVGVRRLHDVGKSGLNMLWLFLPIIGWIYLIYLCVQESVQGANQWGDEPQKIDL